ncbi:hypothetical protein BpHYR1_026521 [Brachionus plicatilis]|uniref:Uncharacterized protein n=1 Tax=Brachionus plicatilis TaxID=10195 RepID=A0A3M7QTN7_BRAPC|nr:hypothetical protein BpHYR1_026521 [Brachionus plicatilis]
MSANKFSNSPEIQGLEPFPKPGFISIRAFLRVSSEYFGGLLFVIFKILVFIAIYIQLSVQPEKFTAVEKKNFHYYPIIGSTRNDEHNIF